MAVDTQHEHRFMYVLFVWVLCCLIPIKGYSHTTLRLATASNFKPALDALITQYTLTHPDVRFDVSSASSGLLFHQISQGAPFDLFFSADQTYPDTLLKRHKVNAPLYHYTSGTLCVVSTSPAPFSFESLTRISRIAIANPAFAPYGIAAKKWLLAQHYAGQIIYGNNVSHTLSYLLTGHIDTVITACALQYLSHKSHFIWLPLPQESYPAITQYAAIISDSKHINVSTDFMTYIQSPNAQALLYTLGYQSILPTHVSKVKDE